MRTDRRRVLKGAELEARLKALRDGLSSGATLESIGQTLGVTRERVRQLIRQFGLVNPRRMNRPRERIQREDFVSRVAQMSQRDLAKHYGCSLPTVRLLMAEWGVSRRQHLWEVTLDRIKNSGECWCSKCRAWKPVGEFYRLTSSKTGYMPVCADCVKQRYDQNRQRKDDALAKVAKLEKALMRALCGCTAKDCTRHGSYVPEEVGFALRYKR